MCNVLLETLVKAEKSMLFISKSASIKVYSSKDSRFIHAWLCFKVCFDVKPIIALNLWHYDFIFGF